MVAAGLVLGAVVLLGGDEAAEPEPARPAVPTTDPLSYPGQGLRMQRPVGWSAERARGVIRLRAPDGSIQVAIAAERRSVPPQRVRRAALRAVRAGLRSARPAGASRLSLGGLRARARELRGRTRAGEPVDVVVAATRGRWRTYALTVVRRAGSPPARQEELAGLLGSIRVHRPRR